MSIALGLKLRIGRITSALASVITTNLQAWHKFTATAWSGSDRLPDSSPVGTNTAALYTGRALDFDGVNDVVTVGDTGATVKTVVFYANPDTTTQSFMQLQSSGAVRIQIASGTLSATGFTTPTLYVNGVASSSVSASSWQMIAVTSATGVSASNVLFGQQNTTFYSGSLSNVKFFSTELNSTQIAELYANPEQALPTGASDSDLVGCWSLAEGAGTIAFNAVASGVNGLISGSTALNAITGAVPQWGIASKSLAMAFDGVNDSVTISDSSSLDLASGDNFTISAYVYIHAMASDTVYGIYNKNAYGSTSFSFSLRGTASYNGLLFRVGAVVQDFTPATNLTSSIVGGWRLVTVRRSGTTLDFFLNGTKYTSATSYSGYNLANATAASIGASDSSSGGSFTGMIMWTAFWKTAISDADVAALSAMTSTPDQISASDLKGYWKNLGNTTSVWLDASGNGNHATGLTGSPSLTTLLPSTTTGKDISGLALQNTNNGYMIIGGDGYASLSDAATLDITSTITLEAWVKPSVTSAAQTIIGKNGSYALGITSAGKPVFTKWTSAASTATATTTTTLTLNTWFHVATVYDGANVKIYINGALNTTTAVTGAMDATSAAVLLGAKTTSTELFTGCIDSAKIYSSALTAGEVATNYAAEVSTHQ